MDFALQARRTLLISKEFLTGLGVTHVLQVRCGPSVSQEFCTELNVHSPGGEKTKLYDNTRGVLNGRCE
jgi:hypothetical protein